ncbi:MAG: hypothetical protein AAGA02_04915 [Bacteroidota bacterium]
MYCNAITTLSIILFIHYNYLQSTSLSIDIKAIDLSEDLNKLSTQNDELILLIYEVQDIDATLNEPLYSSEFTLDSKTNRQQLTTGIHKQSNLELLMLVLERDTERPIAQIEPVVRIHFNELIEAQANNDYNLIRKYLGNEDILGTKRITLPISRPTEFKLQGIQKMDRYTYVVILY